MLFIDTDVLAMQETKLGNEARQTVQCAPYMDDPKYTDLQSH